ncbi:MAG: PIG-L deacetylase family protein [Paeniclostridium sordellii]|uniref:PIG-L family deacetylase n=1 Tax=Paeniclostridium hominis TaxID=2764329 RepID=A0ABR7K3Z3_9FIRM|nr:MULTISPECIES: PIG-L deacetylase family protein [Paeniclostridium]MBC6003819.1 PIG-L family deacetylase [Paeniclostridium hominis]MDU2592529.1 PIG-L deacetylase family protein [Paeniclostridium sordellii]
MSYLVVVAHPDDEILGAGATIYKLAQENKEVNVCILCGDVEVRQYRPETEELNYDINSATNMVGIKRVIKGVFPNIALNTVKHLDLVQFIENAIIETKADVVFTHHPKDLNNDHYHTSIACQAATRIYQRRTDIKPLKELLFMEVPSATEWSTDSSGRQFTPNVFVEVGEERVKKKIEALSLYRGVMRPYPHPRSKEGITGLAAYRGSQSGTMYAEAFESAFRRIDISDNI